MFLSFIRIMKEPNFYNRDSAFVQILTRSNRGKQEV